MKTVIRHDRYYVVEVEPTLVAETSATSEFIGSEGDARFPSVKAAMKAAAKAKKYLHTLAKRKAN